METLQKLKIRGRKRSALGQPLTGRFREFLCRGRCPRPRELLARESCSHELPTCSHVSGFLETFAIPHGRRLTLPNTFRSAWCCGDQCTRRGSSGRSSRARRRAALTGDMTPGSWSEPKKYGGRPPLNVPEGVSEGVPVRRQFGRSSASRLPPESCEAWLLMVIGRSQTGTSWSIAASVAAVRQSWKVMAELS